MCSSTVKTALWIYVTWPPYLVHCALAGLRMWDGWLVAPWLAPPRVTPVDHHITGENMLISEIYADTSDRSVLASAGRRRRRRKSYERSGWRLMVMMMMIRVMCVMLARPLHFLPTLSIHLHLSQTEGRESRNITITPRAHSGFLATL